MATDFDWHLTNDHSFLSRLRIPNEADREDAIQDAALKLFSKAGAVTPELLYASTLNCHKDRVKAESRRKKREQAHSLFDNFPRYQRAARDHDHYSTPPSDDQRQLESIASSLDPSARLVKLETRAAIKRAIREAGLSRNHRCALWAWIGGRLQQFAARRRIAPTTARVWVYRAQESLRPHLISQGIGP